jgi:hypothetical protein
VRVRVPRSTIAVAAAAALALGATGFVGSRFVTVQAQSAQPASWPSRTPDGQPDIQGLWASNTGVFSLNMEPMKYLMTIGMPPMGRRPVSRGRAALPEAAGTIPDRSPVPIPADRSAGGIFLEGTILLDPPDHILPYQAWARAKRDAVMKDYLHPSPAQIDPQTRGWPNGIPRENYYSSHDGSVGGPIQILQPPGFVVFFYETHHEFRIVPLDGRPHAGQGIKLWEGDSRGRWEGNTLVVDVTNNNDSTRFNVIGDFHSDAMRVTERWTFVDQNTLEYKATVDDPKVYTQPWTIGVTHTRNAPGSELMEYAGVEGDADAREAEAISRAQAAKKAPPKKK